MKGSSIRAIFVVAGLVIASMLGAQATERELTVEELYLRDIEFQILSEKAFSDNREIKLDVLDEIEIMIEEGQVDDPDKVEFVLEYLGMEGTARRVRENARLINYYPEVRRRSANLLGRLGGKKAKDALVSILLIDDEPMVKAEAAYALGVIGMNDGNEVVRALLYTLENEDPQMPDNNLAYAVCLAVEKIVEANDGELDSAAYADLARTLVRIAQGNYIKTVRRKALQTLEILKEYQS
ncbi:MAG: HEAT repeat domain-containing protein [Spirochaetaceae bacterium]|nr:MAG: HEAT repeat domain-containing protein [Spirochaetaceae bacterium]